MIYNLGKALNFSLCGISRVSKARGDDSWNLESSEITRMSDDSCKQLIGTSAGAISQNIHSWPLHVAARASSPHDG